MECPFEIPILDGIPTIVFTDAYIKDKFHVDYEIGFDEQTDLNNLKRISTINYLTN